jgi:DNA mismatch repair protein MutS
LAAPLPELRAQLEASLRPEAEGHKDGSAVADGVRPELDAARRLAAGAQDELLAYEERVRAESGIRTAKVGYNRVFGYYIEVGRARAQAVPPEWVRRQTLAGAERYITPFLSSLEARIAAAEAERAALEAAVLEELGREVVAKSQELHDLMQRVSEVDVLAAMADVAVERGYVRPRFGDGAEIAIERGRHPVLETVLPPGRFVPNDIRLGRDARLIILTGPNMAGKSTVLRQVALLQMLAQMGSFVPAAAMRTSVFDAIYTRIGAADDLAGGRSTFMVEMSEVARILEAVDRPALVLLDEVGRGTSTYDGLSLAWAIAEELHERPMARTLLATHYLELADLPRLLPAARNLSVAVRERGEEVLFLHQLVEGPADRSYGLHVARLAGVPARVVARAARILAELEAGVTARRQVAATREQSFRFTEPPPDHPIVVALRDVRVEELRPVDALVLLDRLVREARGERP